MDQSLSEALALRNLMFQTFFLTVSTLLHDAFNASCSMADLDIVDKSKSKPSAGSAWAPWILFLLHPGRLLLRIMLQYPIS